MRKNKKVLFIVLAAVLVVGATLGAVAIAQANDQGGFLPQSGNTSLFQKIATIYKTNTGTTIDPTALQTAFQQAQQQLATEARDSELQKLVTAGKITQKQADDYKNWLNSMPGNALTDQYKQWLQSRPEGVPFGPGMHGPMMPRGFDGMMGKMFRR